jgi:hypothetical protein
MEDWTMVCSIYLREKSIRKTAATTGLSKNGVAYILEKSGVTRFPRNRKGSENSSVKAIKEGTASAKVRDKQLMQELYVNQRLSTVQIASLLGCDPKTVCVGLGQCGIAARTQSAAIRGRPRPKAQGANHRDWKGGITNWRKLARGRLNTVFVRPVMERDNFTCRHCGSKKSLTVHHVMPFHRIVARVLKRGLQETDKILDAVVAEHRLDYGITLCKGCHDAYHLRYGK